ncbi:hypothetical protein BDN72DRAFT_146317 [Pluteus cervinus]|uniref:Uncharacterized protein n=1 Tax=Pluteus cervinus TaxID=181527 RepID=A0ACD3AMC0_9AGAR|nr:hypothetical protein BDN72DRAFT_146317 [Pluteus cervinus]
MCMDGSGMMAIQTKAREEGVQTYEGYRSIRNAEYVVDHRTIIEVAAEPSSRNTTMVLLVTKEIPEKPKSIRTSEDDRTPSIKEVIFRLRSCDQGWGGDPDAVGPYDGSFTWFGAVVFRPDETGGPVVEGIPRWPFENREALGKYKPVDSWVIQRNKRADHKYRRHEIVWTQGCNFEWDGTVGGGTGEGFVDALRPGDKITIVAHAEYLGSVNKIKYAEVEVVFSC